MFWRRSFDATPGNRNSYSLLPHQTRLPAELKEETKGNVHLQCHGKQSLRRDFVGVCEPHTPRIPHPAGPECNWQLWLGPKPRLNGRSASYSSPRWRRILPSSAFNSLWLACLFWVRKKSDVYPSRKLSACFPSSPPSLSPPPQCFWALRSVPGETPPPHPPSPKM